MAQIVSWESYFGGRSLFAHAIQNPSSVGDRTLPAQGISPTQKVVARVSGGMWIADCPTDGCAGAELVDFTELLFFCCECRNAEVGHQPITIEIPPPQKRADIEAYLEARPATQTRNWLPQETVSFLRDENQARGIGLLKEAS